MLQKLESSSLWYAKDLQERNDWQYQLTTEDLEEIDNAWQKVKPFSCEKVCNKEFVLPKFSQKLAKIQDFLEKDLGIVLIKGFPINKYQSQELKSIFFGLASYIGTAISQSATDEKIFSVRNEGHKEGSAKARGPNTKNKLSFHTDRCDVIAFMCLQQAKSGGENMVVSSMALHNEILAQRPDLLEVLYQPFYYKRHNVDMGNNLSYCQMPVFTSHQGYFAANIMRVLIFRAYQMPELPDISPLQKEALEFVENLAQESKMHICFKQETGDILFLNNFVTFHSRTAFEDYSESQKRRHLLRIWLSVPNSRPLSPLFAPNYGDTSAGAIRGGMKANS